MSFNKRSTVAYRPRSLKPLKPQRPLPVKTYKHIAKIRLFLSLFLFIGFTSFVLCMQGMRDVVFSADAAVVLGNEVYKNGQCSPRLAARLDAAVKLYNEKWVPRIIVSGGVGKSEVDEATAMQAYLIRRGVPESAIIVDSSGVNTRATAEFTAKYFAENNLHSVIGVSQFFHLPRVVLALKMSGIKVVGSCHAEYFEARDVYSVVREIPAYLAYWSHVK